MTAQELLEYSHEPYRQELIDGILFEMEPPGAEHGWVASQIAVVSPDDRRSKVEGKALHWLSAGTRAVVVLDPPLRTATVYLARDDIRVLTEDEQLAFGDAVPGWSARVGDLFV